jgi:cytochrome P450
LARQVKEIREGINDAHKHARHSTIFHELLNSDLPAEEKSDARLGDEAQLIIAAGLITTSWALSVGSFHIANDPKVSEKLREELKAAKFEPSISWHKLEKLPYLNGCVHEAIRLAHGIATRAPRLAPDDDLIFEKWVIPRNTAVSMSTYDILMNERIFPSSKCFVPERWIRDPELDRYFVPFGKGSRACAGIKYVALSSFTPVLCWHKLYFILTYRSLAQAELYITFATLFSQFSFEPFETDSSDVEMAHAYLIPYPKWETKGVRMKVKSA